MSCVRLYAAPLMLLAWAFLSLTLSETVELLALRLFTFSVSLAISIHELARRHRRRDRN